MRVGVLLLAVLGIAGCETCRQNWDSEPVELGIHTNLHAVVSLERGGSLDLDRYLAVGADGTVVVWGYDFVSDGVELFANVSDLGDADLRGIWRAGTFIAPTRSWVVGDAGTIAVSDNVGSTWTKLAVIGDQASISAPSGAADLYAITGFDDRPVIVGDEIVLVQREDQTWIEPPVPAGGWGQLRGVTSADDGRIYAVGLGGAFFSTADPSGEWTRMTDDIDEDLFAVGRFIAPYQPWWPTNTVAIVGAGGTVLIGEANDWRRLETDVSADLIAYHNNFALGSDGDVYLIDVEQSEPLILGDMIEGARALSYDPSLGVITVGDGGLATRPPHTIVCHR